MSGFQKKNDFEADCLSRGLRPTPARVFVYDIIRAARKPLGAYDILAALGRKMPNPKPPTAYRAIEFLQDNGFIHRIESLNAYVVCHADHTHHGSQFMICDDCGKVIETHLCDVPGPLAERAKKEKFTVVKWNAELHGTCADCR